MKNELNYYVDRLKTAADTIIKFFDEAIAVAKKYEADTSCVAEFESMIREIKPAGITYSAIHEEVVCNMGMDAFFNNEEIQLISVTVHDKQQELRHILIPLIKE